MPEARTIGLFGGKFSPLHNGHLAAIVEASTRVDELHVVVITDDAWEREHLYADSKVPFFDSRHRARWLRRAFKDHPHVRVHVVHEPATGDDWADWRVGREVVRQALGDEASRGVTHFFSSEHDYQDFVRELYPGAEYVVLDPDRRGFPISATMIRRDGAAAHWDMVPAVVRGDLVKRVVLMGSESNGKSVMAANLALYYGTEYVAEYGRAFLAELGDDDDTIPEDYPRIAMGHFLRVEEAAERANRVLFVDTDALVTQNFSRLYEGFHQPVLDAIARLQRFDLVLYLTPEVPWVFDGSRAFGDAREDADAGLRALLVEHGVSLVEVAGSDFSQRFHQAVEAVDQVLGL